jgi:metal-responsive CopG/Arc/MetJ family transcriptional regulator
MARKQVIVQLDEELVKALDRVAKRNGVSRSDLIRRASRALLDALTEAEADRQLLQAYGRVPQEAWIVEAGRHLASELELGPPPRE